MNGAKAFVDTNVFLYLHGGSDQAKRAQAKELLSDFNLSHRMIISTQVVQEFYVNARRLGMARPALAAAAASLLSLPMVVVGAVEIRSAMANEERYGISFWDALILAAAETGGAETIYTEDLNDRRRYGPITVRNPFRETAP